MNFSYRLSAALVGTAMVAVQLPFSVAVAQDVSTIAQEITVRINGPKQGGSGVIVKREGNDYTVLTNWHVVDNAGDYVIKTADGRRHRVNSRRKLPGLDLAVLDFSSTQRYRVAELGNSENVSRNQSVYVSGWLNPIPGINERSYQFIEGKITSILSQSEDGGYALVYSNIGTYRGMSGGPLLNEQGQVVGINGKAAGDSITGPVGLYLGIPINTFERLQAAFATPNPRSNQQQSYFSPCDIAKAITVKVLAGGSWESGILVQRQENTYTVVTNDHVLLGDRYRIQTPDGRVHAAKRLVKFDRSNIGDDDLAVLQFNSRNNYEIAILAPMASLSERQKVLSAGFPVNTDPFPGLSDTGIVCLWPGGIISLILDRPMQEGYQIGFHLDMFKGMSGGPLLNERGEVIGVNGKLFETPDSFVYKNGTRVQQPLDLMTRSSWAIPIETFVQHALSSVYSER